MLDRAEEFETFEVRMFGIPESELARVLREIEEDADLSPLEITTCLRGGELVTDVRHRSGAEEAREALLGGLKEKLGQFTYSYEGEAIETVVARLLGGRMLGGRGIVHRRAAGRPLHRRAGVVAVVLRRDRQLLERGEVRAARCRPELIEAKGAVSPEVAEAMADGALERFGADAAVLGHGHRRARRGTKEKPVGYVCFCAKLATGEVLARDPVLPGDRGDIRQRSTMVALHLLRYLLEGREPPR